VVVVVVVVEQDPAVMVVNQFLDKQPPMVVAVVQAGPLLDDQVDRVVVLLTILKEHQVVLQINQINRKAVKVLVIGAELVSIVHPELMYGVVVVVVPELKVLMPDLYSEHRKVLQAEPEEPIA
jgi:hypothetical protein